MSGAALGECALIYIVVQAMAVRGTGRPLATVPVAGAGRARTAA